MCSSDLGATPAAGTRAADKPDWIWKLDDPLFDKLEGMERLAKALNVSVDTLKQAVEATRTELKDTKPTTAAERQAFRDQYEATLAAKLHISVDALKQAEDIRDGKA